MITYDLKVTNTDIGTWYSTVSRVLNLPGGATNDDYTRYPSVLYNKINRNLEFGFMICDGWSFTGGFMVDYQIVLTPNIQIQQDQVYSIEIRRTASEVYASVDGVSDSRSTDNVNVCKDGRSTELKFFTNMGFNDEWDNGDSWAEVTNINISE